MYRHLFTEIKSKLKDRSGFLLMNIVLLLLVLTITVSSLSFSALTNSKGADLSTNHNSVYYYAEGGLNEFGEKFHDYIDEMEASDLKAFTELTTYEIAEKLNQDIVQGISIKTTLMNQEASRMITLTPQNDGEAIEVLSTATLGGVSRTVSQMIYNVKDMNNLDPVGLCIDYAMAARSQYILTGKIEIYGNAKLLEPGRLYSESETPSIIEDNAGSINVTGTFTLGPRSGVRHDQMYKTAQNKKWESFVKDSLGERLVESDKQEYIPVVEMPALPSGANVVPLTKDRMENITSNDNNGTIEIKYDNDEIIKYTGGSYLNLHKNTPASVDTFRMKRFVQNGYKKNTLFTIYVGNRNINLIMDEVDLNGSITVKGTGSLRIYIKNDTQHYTNQFNPLRIQHESGKKEKLTFVLYNDASKKPKEIQFNSGCGKSIFESFTLIAENHNLSMEKREFYQVNLMLLGKDNVFTTPYSKTYSDKSQWDLIFIPFGKVDYRSKGFRGSITADIIQIHHGGATIEYDKEYTGTELPDEFDIFSPSACKGIGGSGENGPGGELTLGPIREVKP